MSTSFVHIDQSNPYYNFCLVGRHRSKLVGSYTVLFNKLCYLAKPPMTWSTYKDTLVCILRYVINMSCNKTLHYVDTLSNSSAFSMRFFWEDIQGLWNEPDQLAFSYLVHNWHYLPKDMTHTVATDVSIIVLWAWPLNSTVITINSF